MTAALPAASATGTWHVQAFPAFGTHAKIADFLARAAWHFVHVPDFQLYLPLAPGVAQPSHLKVPDDFDPAVQAALDAYLPRVKFQLDRKSVV